MAKERKKKKEEKQEAKPPSKESAEKIEKPFDFGGIPHRDLKKNLGCG